MTLQQTALHKTTKMQSCDAYEPVKLKPQSLRHTTTHPQQQQATARPGAETDTAQRRPACNSTNQTYYSALKPRPDSVTVKQSLQDKYQLGQLPCGHSQPSDYKAADDTNTASSTGLKAALTQQHARKQQQKQQRISAVRASAAAVSLWTQQQLEQGSCASPVSSVTSPSYKTMAAAAAAAAAPGTKSSPAGRSSTCQAPTVTSRTPKSQLHAVATHAPANVTSQDLQQLPPSVLQVMSSEAERGLLHLQALGLLPRQLELTHALIGAAGSSTPVQMHAAVLHRLTADSSSGGATSAQFSPGRHNCSQKQQQISHHTQQQNTKGPLSAKHLRHREAESAQADKLQLLIYAGHLVQDSADMVSLVQAAAEQGLWPSTAALLAQLQALCRAFTVPLAVIDGCMVVRLASTLSQPAAGISAGAADALRQPLQHQQRHTAEPPQQVSSPCVQGVGCVPGSVQQVQIGLADLLACFINLDDVVPYLED